MRPQLPDGSLIATLALALLLVLVAPVALAAQRVLLLNSYHPQYRWTAELTHGVQDELASVLGEENLYIEYLDGRRMVDDPVYFEALERLLAVKFSNLRPDVVITSDDYAFEFMRQRGDRLFPGVPVVFCGVNVFDPAALDGHPNYTGLLEGMEIEGNLALIRRLQPAVRRVIMLADRTSFGRVMAEHARAVVAAEAKAHPAIRYEIWDDFELDSLQAELAALPADAAVLMLAIHKDRDGRYFAFADDLPTLTARAAVPVYGMWGALMIGHGVVGGMMNDPYQHGRAAAAMARSILAGSPVAAIPMVGRAVYRPQFDYRVLQRFAIPEDRLPADSRVEFAPDTLWHRYRAQLLGIGAAIVALLAIIAVLTLNVRRRQHAETELQQLNEQLEQRIQARTVELEQRAEELARLQVVTERLAYTDALTELPNRRAGQELLKTLHARSGQAGPGYSIGLFDIDHFKRVNDQHGHDVGDTVLVEVSARASAALRPLDRLYRWGGEEFLLVIADEDIDSAAAIGERLRSRINVTPITSVGIITVSIGVAQARPDDSLRDLLDRADQALYRAKMGGRNQVQRG